MGNIDYDNLFAFTAEDALTVTESKKKNSGNPDVYKPNIKDEKCKDGKTISLSRVRKMTKKVDFLHLKEKVDEVVEVINKR